MVLKDNNRIADKQKKSSQLSHSLGLVSSINHLSQIVAILGPMLVGTLSPGMMDILFI